jgi:hypothetical protein
MPRQQVTTTPNPVPPNTAFTVTARVKNLSTEVNTVSVKGYTDFRTCPGRLLALRPGHAALRDAELPLSFMAPASGSF